MDSKTVTLEIADDGTLTIPVDLVRALRLSPRQTIEVETRDDALVLVPSLQRTSVQARKERLDRIGRLLRTALADVEWFEIEAGRRDRNPRLLLSA
jgi:bifunctional DNA-binding transcriptional regulator/antitoxin component of YhaV-PrlF toxin-antitoxin module